ncbi:hypothetical protein YDYSY3_25510 [Paenibacillus chitinolyticus]|nr:hypothetical protein YDYSY3_25510 [Paenibacillus chitinolyticus]
MDTAGSRSGTGGIFKGKRYLRCGQAILVGKGATGIYAGTIIRENKERGRREGQEKVGDFSVRRSSFAG